MILTPLFMVLNLDPLFQVKTLLTSPLLVSHCLLLMPPLPPPSPISTSFSWPHSPWLESWGNAEGEEHTFTYHITY